MSNRGGFIQDVSEALKDKIAMAEDSMDLDPKLKPAFLLGLHMGVDTILELTKDTYDSKAEYRIYPVTQVIVADPEPVSFYAYDRGIERSGETNHLVKEIWDMVNS